MTYNWRKIGKQLFFTEGRGTVVVGPNERNLLLKPSRPIIIASWLNRYTTQLFSGTFVLCYQAISKYG